MGGAGIYSIGTVAGMLGVPVATLRAWHDRYGVIEPDRSAGGHRLYSRQQVEQLRFVTEQVARGRSPAEAHRLLAESLARGPDVEFVAPEGPILVLVAERDEYGAQFSEFFLKTEGFEVLATLDADEAAGALGNHAPHVAVIELLVGQGKGFGLCRLASEAGVPVVAISTLDAADLALDAGASAFLRRPVDPLELVSTVKDLLGRSALLRRPIQEGA